MNNLRTSQNIQSLADFKRIIQSALVHKLRLKSKTINKHSEVVKENDFAPVAHIQSNAFALLRNDKLSWMEYGKAKEWSFDGGKATRKLIDGGQIVFEIENLEFFGLQ